MITYKNTSLAVKTFYGVVFKPGEIHSVPGFITDVTMIRVDALPKEHPKADNVVQSLNKPGQSKKSGQKQSNESNKIDNKEENPDGKHND